MGRPDITITTPIIRKGRAMVIEFKVAGSLAQLEAKADEAISQIDDEQYAKPFADEGYPLVQKYGISFYKKECMVKKGTDIKSSPDIKIKSFVL